MGQGLAMQLGETAWALVHQPLAETLGSHLKIPGTMLFSSREMALLDIKSETKRTSGRNPREERSICIFLMPN